MHICTKELDAVAYNSITWVMETVRSAGDGDKWSEVQGQSDLHREIKLTFHETVSPIKKNPKPKGSCNKV